MGNGTVDYMKHQLGGQSTNNDVCETGLHAELPQATNYGWFSPHTYLNYGKKVLNWVNPISWADSWYKLFWPDQLGVVKQGSTLGRTAFAALPVAALGAAVVGGLIPLPSCSMPSLGGGRDDKRAQILAVIPQMPAEVQKQIAQMLGVTKLDKASLAGVPDEKIDQLIKMIQEMMQQS